MVEHYSYKIQNVIQKELFKANSSIKIAVAWFTNELLLQPLILKLQTGVAVELIINDDEINKGGESSLNFVEFIESGGVLYWNTSKKLMHDKFCIIDDKVVIMGSYNWTNKAEYNNETISVFKDEAETLDFFKDIFLTITKSLSPCVAVRSLSNATLKKKTRKGFINNELDLYYYDSNGARYSKDCSVLFSGANVEFFEIKPCTKIIKESAFKGFAKLKQIDLSSVAIIEDHAFEGCNSLETVEINNVNRIGRKAFKNCSSLRKVCLLTSKFFRDSFEGCVSISELEIKSLRSLLCNNNKENVSLSEFFPDSVCIKYIKVNSSNITNRAFANLSSLETVYIRKSYYVTIGNEAFYGCKNLKRIEIDSKLTEIGEDAFCGCTSLSRLSFKGYVSKMGAKAFYNCVSLKELPPVKGLIEIRKYAFQGCRSLTSLEIATDVKIISESSFAGCTSLRSIMLPKSVKEIRSDAFSGCTSLKKINIPDSIEVLDMSAFQGCSSLKSLSIPYTAKLTDICTTYGSNCNFIIRSPLTMDDSTYRLSEKNEMDRRKSEFKFYQSSIYFNGTVKPSELSSIFDGEIIILPEKYILFHRKLEFYKFVSAGMFQLPELDEDAPREMYINVLTNTGRVVELNLSLLDKIVAFEVDDKGKHIRENGRWKRPYHNTDNVRDFFHSLKIEDALDAMAGCQIKFNYLKSVRVRRFDKSEDDSTEEDVYTRVLANWSFVGSKRPKYHIKEEKLKVGQQDSENIIVDNRFRYKLDIKI